MDTDHKPISLTPRQQYNRKYHAANREKNIAKMREYYWLNREKSLKQSREWREANASSASYKEKRRQYYLKNRESIIAKNTAWRKANWEKWAKKSKELRDANKDQYLQKNRDYYSANRDQCVEKQRARRKANPQKFRFRDKRRKYGMTRDDFMRRLKSQDNRCALCRAVFQEVGVFAPHIDHNHAGNFVRGLLCSSCNLALGYVEKRGWEPKQFAINSAAYLARMLSDPADISPDRASQT